ncbi:unnamed protein product, partial [Mesorhabditis belari]|uniref:N-acetyltransferase domain-containing protein n=1 Tax=Mesorhabditis belari TaxID=2138241 RepID=A0AAF3EAW4_9BILA
MALGDDDLMSISFQTCALVIAGLPFTGFLLCLFLALFLHFEETTQTHCGVDNWLPSVSAAVSSVPPEIYIWRIFIAVHGGPRLVLAFIYRNLLLTSPLRPLTHVKIFRYLCHFGCGIHIAENLFLIGLTCISSRENHEAHKISFFGFVLTSFFYMFVATWLFSYSGRRRTTSLGETSYEYKVLASVAALISIFVAMSVRHSSTEFWLLPRDYPEFLIARFNDMPIEITEIKQGDADDILRLIKGLAVYEKMPDAVELTVSQLKIDIETKAVLGYIARAEENHEMVGMLLFYLPYSTWQGQYVHMEDLYVDPKYRQLGIGKKLWAKLAEYAANRNIKRLQWNVLDWNQPAISFYEKLPCRCLTKEEGWLLYRMGPDDIKILAKHAD